MSIELIRRRSQLVANAKCYVALVEDGFRKLSSDLRKTASETITRTQAWIAVRDIDENGEDVWMVAPQKWIGQADIDIDRYEENRKSGVDVQKIGHIIGKMGCYPASRGQHDAWEVVEGYADHLGLELRSGTTLWVIEGEDLPYTDRFLMDVVTDIVEVRKLSDAARKVLANRLAA